MQLGANGPMSCGGQKLRHSVVEMIGPACRVPVLTACIGTAAAQHSCLQACILCSTVATLLFV